MDDPKPLGAPTLNALLLQSRMLPLVMLMGVSAFAAFVVLSVAGVIPFALNSPTGILSTSTPGIGAIVGAIVAAFLGHVIERSMDTKAKAKWAASKDQNAGRVEVARVLLTQTLVRAALSEGFALLGLVAVLFSKDWSGIGAYAVAVIVMVLLLGSESRFEALMERVKGSDPFGGARGPHP